MEVDEDLSLDGSDTDYHFLKRPQPRPRNLALSFNFDPAECDAMDDQPSTPVNRDRLSNTMNRSDASSDVPLTPLPSMENDELSSYNMHGVDRNMNKSNITSTPMSSLGLHSRSFPTSLKRIHSADTRQCKSYENLRFYRFGLEDLPLEYMNPFTPDGKLIMNKANAQKQLKR